MTLIGEACPNGRLKNCDVGISQKLASSLNSPAQHILMRREAKRLFEQFREVVRAHPGCIRQCGKCYLLFQVRVDVFQNSVEARSGKTILRFHLSRRVHTITDSKMDCESVQQRLSKEFARGNAGFEIRFEGAKNVFDLRITHTPLVDKFWVGIIFRESLPHDRWIQIQENPFHGL